MLGAREVGELAILRRRGDGDGDEDGMGVFDLQ